MTAKKMCSGLALATVLTLVGSAPTFAGPYFGEWGWWWHPAPDCPRGAYSPLHYWAPSAYQLRAQIHPSNVDQFAPGPTPSVPPIYEIEKMPCRSTPPTPMSPYADPDGYYGRPIAPPQK
jgi:hypothetical protein